MATSGSTDFNLNSREICTAAIIKLGVLDPDETPTASQAAQCLQALNLMLKTWSASEHLWIRTAGTLVLTEGTITYPIPTARRMESVRRSCAGIDVPLAIYSRDEYDDVPNKGGKGTPIAWYFDPQRTTRTLYVWLTADAATALSTTLSYTYRRVIEDVDTLDNDEDVPQEWLETLIYNLAVRVAPAFGVGSTNPDFADIKATAFGLLEALKEQDQDDTSIFLTPQFQ